MSAKLFVGSSALLARPAPQEGLAASHMCVASRACTSRTACLCGRAAGANLQPIATLDSTAVNAPNVAATYAKYGQKTSFEVGVVASQQHRHSGAIPNLSSPGAGLRSLTKSRYAYLCQQLSFRSKVRSRVTPKTTQNELPVRFQFCWQNQTHTTKAA